MPYKNFQLCIKKIKISMIRLLITDDSIVYREVIKRIVEQDDEIKIIGFAKDGEEAIAKVKELKPDILLLDYQMPKLNGVEVVKKLMVENPIPILLFSTFTKEGAEVTNTALRYGAVDFLLKPQKPDEIENIKNELIKKIKIASRVKVIKRFHLIEKWSRPVKKISERYEIVLLGISTGGPSILDYILRNLKSDFSLPLVICQHMPEKFTKSLAEQLKKLCSLEVKETEDRERIREKVVYIAKGGNHTIITKDREFKIEDVNVFGIPAPSVNELFKSAAEVYKDKILGIIMTGMGNDGTEGARRIKEAGGDIIAQDEETSIVFGMPKSAIETGVVDEILSVEKIVEKLNNL